MSFFAVGPSKSQKSLYLFKNRQKTRFKTPLLRMRKKKIS